MVGQRAIIYVIASPAIEDKKGNMKCRGVAIPKNRHIIVSRLIVKTQEQNPLITKYTKISKYTKIFEIICF